MTKRSKKQQRYAFLNQATSKMGLLVIGAISFGIVGVYGIIQSNAQKATTGNGAPSGSHYNLNIIGVPKGKTASITSGNRIFVPLEGTCKIDLIQGDFTVIDGNCSDGSKAAFQLPNPDPDGDGTTEYTVWARPLGKPGGKATVTTCGTDPLTLEEVCSIEATTFVRERGKSTFSNTGKGFLTVLVDLDGDPNTAPERLSIFDPALEGYLWSYDNNGLRLLQLRFYPVANNVN